MTIVIQRLLTSKILSDLAIYPGVVLLGPRQVGKTTLAQQQLAFDPGNSKYLDLERPSDLNKLTDAERYFMDNRDQTLIIDEIQRKPDLFPILRSEIDQDRRPGRFVLLGSSSDDLINLSTESLAGRVAFHELHPLCVQELPYQQHQTLWLVGGYPQSLLLAGRSEDSFTWVGNLVRSHIQRELSARLLNILPHEMELLLRLVSSINGQLVNYSELAKSAQVTLPTIKKYLYFMERAYLLRILQPYHANSKKRLVKSPKIYIRDSGITHYLSGHETHDSIEGDYHKGAAWEGHVIQQIFAMTKPDNAKYFYRTAAGAESDLLLLKGSKPFMTFEVKYSNSPKITRSTTSAINDLKCQYNYVVTPSSDRYFIRENLEVIGLQHLEQVLKEQNILINADLQVKDN